MRKLYVDPAYAGMILTFLHSVPFQVCGPRVCGDDPIAIPSFTLWLQWTPRMRG